MSHAGDRLGAINGLRGIAILCVIFHHLFAARFPSGWHAVLVGEKAIPIFSPLAHGWEGVALFFVLSGFVLNLPFVSGVRQMTSRANAIEFYRRRATRLLPLYYLNVAVAMIFYAHLNARPLRAVAELGIMATGTFVFTPMFFPRFNFVLWSLGIEIWFSVLFPLLLVAQRRIGIGRLLVISVCVSLGIQAVAQHLPPSVQNIVGGNLPTRLADFVAGMYAAEKYVRGDLERSWWGRWWSPIVGVLVLYTSFCVWDMCKTGNLPSGFVIFTLNLSDLGFFLLVVGALRHGRFERLLSIGPLQIIGMMCFSLYVWHAIAKAEILGGDAIHYEPVELLVYIVLLSVISLLTYRYVEFRYVQEWRALFRPIVAPRAQRD